MKRCLLRNKKESRIMKFIRPLQKREQIHVGKLDGCRLFGLEAAWLHVGTTVLILCFDAFPIYTLDFPWAIHRLPFGIIGMSGDIKHLGCGITVLIGIAVDLALAPFKFLKTGSDPG